MSGIAEAAPVAHFYRAIVAAFAGPTFLIAGPLLLLRKSWRRIGALLSSFGCIILTVYAIQLSIASFHENPLNQGFAFGVCGVFRVVTLLTDLAGFHIWRVVFRRAI
jgi:hypothetical protein